MRFGIGYDFHRLIPTQEVGSIPLGGVRIPCALRVAAHSDGDVLLHALVDACMGALALGDIGQRFPDSAPENAGRPSSEFLLDILKEITALGWKVSQIDSVILLEQPKIAPHADAIRRNLATLLGIELSSVSLKAKTMEGAGPIGERKGFAAQVIAVLTPSR